MALKLMFKGLWQNVWFANKIRWKQFEEIKHNNIKTRRLAEKASSLNSQHAIHLNDKNI
jgi:hypothetical protein